MFSEEYFEKEKLNKYRDEDERTVIAV